MHLDILWNFELFPQVEASHWEYDTFGWAFFHHSTCHAEYAGNPGFWVSKGPKPQEFQGSIDKWRTIIDRSVGIYQTRNAKHSNVCRHNCPFSGFWEKLPHCNLLGQPHFFFWFDSDNSYPIRHHTPYGIIQQWRKKCFTNITSDAAWFCADFIETNPFRSIWQTVDLRTWRIPGSSSLWSQEHPVSGAMHPANPAFIRLNIKDQYSYSIVVNDFVTKSIRFVFCFLILEVCSGDDHHPNLMIVLLLSMWTPLRKRHKDMKSNNIQVCFWTTS